MIVALAAVLSSCSSFVYQADFAQRADLARRADLLGPYTGRVVDSGTGKPVAKALVYASWEIVRGVGFIAPGGSAVYVTLTDVNGKYQIPKLTKLPSGASRAVANFRLVIYRRGYVAYRSDRIFPGDERRFDFVQLENRIRLERWNPDLSHLDHLRFVGGDGPLRKASTWEVQAAVAQLDGRSLATAGTSPKTGGGDESLLDASELMDEDDIEEVTGYDGGFRISRLNDLPRTSRYDSRHFQAQDKGQQFDAAYRVWRLGKRGAEQHYKKLLKAYPQAKAMDELGDRSFRSRNKTIGGLVWLSRKHGAVVALTCGWKLCQSFAKLIELGKVLNERLGQLESSPSPPPSRPMVPDTNVNPFQPVRPRTPVLK